MAIESNWENCKSQNIMEDLVNIHEHTKVSAPKNFIPMYLLGREIMLINLEWLREKILLFRKVMWR